MLETAVVKAATEEALRVHSIPSMVSKDMQDLLQRPSATAAAPPPADPAAAAAEPRPEDPAPAPPLAARTR